MVFKINPKYKEFEKEILQFPSRFDSEQEVLEKDRNVIKVISVGGMRLNVKSFKRPHVLNRFVYAYLRKSKAKRSYEYAQLLLSKHIGTPEPVAYLVYKDTFGITQSYYISQQLEFDFMFRDLRVNLPSNLDEILRQFTRFTYRFHQAGIYFIDHSPGNTLIRKGINGYEFYLVDLNRIYLKNISPYVGLRNFYRLNASDEMIDVIAGEYARLTGKEPLKMIRLLKKWTHEHDEKVMRKKKRKGKL